eukprot:1157003-Pelagomonas_calceolata.AAC.1
MALYENSLNAVNVTHLAPAATCCPQGMNLPNPKLGFPLSSEDSVPLTLRRAFSSSSPQARSSGSTLQQIL